MSQATARPASRPSARATSRADAGGVPGNDGVGGQVAGAPQVLAQGRPDQVLVEQGRERGNRWFGRRLARPRRAVTPSLRGRPRAGRPERAPRSRGPPRHRADRPVAVLQERQRDRPRHARFELHRQVPAPAGIGLRVVGAVVAAAALGAGQGGGRHQAGGEQQVAALAAEGDLRLVGRDQSVEPTEQPLQPFARALDPGLGPGRAPQLLQAPPPALVPGQPGGARRRDLGRAGHAHRTGQADRRRGRDDRASDPGAEDQRLEQGVRGQTVGAVDAGRGGLAAHPEPRQARPAVQVRGDPAHVVVGGGRDRHRLAPRIDAVLAAQPEDSREPIRERGADRVAGVEEDLPTGRTAPADGPGDHVPRRELRVRVLAEHEALARRVEEDRPFAAQGLGQQRQRIGALGGERRGMELDHLHVEQPGAGPGGHGEAVAGDLRRVGGAGEQPADAAGGKHHRRRAEQPRAAVRPDGGDPGHPPAFAHQVPGEGLLEQAHVAGAANGHPERAHDLGAGGVAVGVEHAAAGVGRLPAEGQAAVRRAVEGGAEGDQTHDAARALRR